MNGAEQHQPDGQPNGQPEGQPDGRTAGRTAGRLDGRIAIVTGGSGGGGRAIVERLVAEGARVAFTFNSSPEAAAAIASSIGEDRCMAVKCDVSDASEIGALVEKVLSTWGKIHILINNAGITKDGLVMRMSESDFESVLRTNLTSAFLTTKAVLRPMMGERWGRIINIASVVGLVGNPGQANYVASKAGLIGMTKSIAREVASRNILVNCVAPGFIQTDMTAKLNEAQQAELSTQIPLKRIGRGEDIAAMVAFLASDDANYITGQVFAVDGGMTMA